MLRRSLQTEDSGEDERFNQMTDALAGNGTTGTGFALQDEAYWSLQAYRKSVSDEKAEEWDELEKSIIAKLADEVKVWLENDCTKVVIEKKITK